MPKATINPEATERVDLRSLEDGYVILRRMSYDAFLTRRDMVTRIKLAARQRGGQQDSAGEVSMQNAKVAVYEFKECIVEHNLEGEDGELLDFSKATTLKLLDPRVGQEIGNAIDKMNQFDDEDELGN